MLIESFEVRDQKYNINFTPFSNIKYILSYRSLLKYNRTHNVRAITEVNYAKCEKTSALPLRAVKNKLA